MPKGIDYVINLGEGNFGGAHEARAVLGGLDETVFSLQGNLKMMATSLITAFGVERVIEFGKESLTAYQASENAAAQVAQAIKTTSGIAGESLEKLRGQAEALEGKTLIGDETTMQAQAILLTFTNIRHEIFDNAVPAVQDLATRMGTDLNSAAVQLGKALNDPITGINALRRVGVSFSDDQRKMIEQDVKHGEIQKAQSIILRELNTEFGGSAEAARRVLGPMGDFNHEVEEGKKALGQYIKDGLNAMIPPLLNSWHWLHDNAQAIGDITKAIGVGVAVWAGYTTIVWGATAAQTAYNWAVGIGSTALEVYEAFQLAVADGMGVMTAAQWALNFAMDANPIGLIVLGIAALAAGLYYAYEKSETFRAILSGIGEVASSLWPIFKGLGEIILGALTLDPNMIKKGWEDSVNAAADIVKNGGISGTFMKGYNQSIDESHKAADDKKEKKPDTASAVFSPKGKERPYSLNTGKTGKGGDTETLSSGSSVRNVRVEIGKLVEHLTIQNTNVQGLNNADIKRQIVELLVGAVHDSELALGH